METATSDDSSMVLKPCSICERTFNPSSLERHEKVCAKNKSSKHRKIFDSSLQRMKDVSVLPAKPSKKQQNKKPNVKWKEQHEALLKTIRSSKNVINNANVMNNGCPSSKNIPSGYIQCPVCLRCFNYKAADRHISWCKEQQSRLPKSPPSFEAMQRLKARVCYRAPLPGRKHSMPFETHRLVKSAESCKSASVPRIHSSPCSLSRGSTPKQVTFQEQFLPPPRRHSCERSLLFSSADSSISNNYTTSGCELLSDTRKKLLCMPEIITALGKKETNHSFDKNFNTPSLNRNSSLRTLDRSPIKFKEKFPNYHKSRNNASVTEQEFGNLLLKDSYSRGKSNGNLDILSALRQQLNELEITERMYRSGYSQNDDDDNICLPVVSSSDLKSSLGFCNILSLEENDCHQSSSSGSDGSLPSLRKQPSSVPRMPRFCYQCGTKYPITSAKYCCECGARRLILSNESVEPIQS